MVGGKVSNRISTPKFSKVVVAFLPNEMPRWGPDHRDHQKDR
jgi:sulfite reductase beta subunit